LWKISIGQFVIPSVLCAITIKLLLAWLREYIYFKNKRVKVTFEIIFLITLNLAVILTPIYGTTYIPSDMFKSISAYFIIWGWGNKNGPTQNTNFFTPLWYQNHSSTVISIMFITPFIPIITSAIIYLLLKCGICYELKRCNKCTEGCCGSDEKGKPAK
jgi:hypothetical protein